MGLSDYRIIPAIAVSEMDRAREFYEGKLGLTSMGERPDGGIRYACGEGSSVHVYPSPANAGKSTATMAGFSVADVEAAVDELIAAGVVFEQYDVGPIKTDEKGIAQLGDVKAAWLKDPDGNIISVNGE